MEYYTLLKFYNPSKTIDEYLNILNNNYDKLDNISQIIFNNPNFEKLLKTHLKDDLNYYLSIIYDNFSKCRTNSFNDNLNPIDLRTNNEILNQNIKIENGKCIDKLHEIIENYIISEISEKYKFMLTFSDISEISNISSMIEKLVQNNPNNIELVKEKTQKIFNLKFGKSSFFNKIIIGLLALAFLFTSTHKINNETQTNTHKINNETQNNNTNLFTSWEYVDNIESTDESFSGIKTSIQNVLNKVYKEKIIKEDYVTQLFLTNVEIINYNLVNNKEVPLSQRSIIIKMDDNIYKSGDIIKEDLEFYGSLNNYKEGFRDDYIIIKDSEKLVNIILKKGIKLINYQNNIILPRNLNIYFDKILNSYIIENYIEFPLVSNSEKNALQLYTTYLYETINKNLRNDKKNLISLIVDEIDSAFLNAPKALNDFIVYRGTNGDYDTKPRLGLNKAYISTSLNDDDSVSFMGSKCCNYIITVKKGVSYLFLPEYTRHSGESEVLLPRGLFMKLNNEYIDKNGLKTFEVSIDYQ